MEIYLIRHTSVNIDKDTCYGISDIELSNNFHSELDIIKAKFDVLNDVDVVFFTSPLKRCIELTKQLCSSQYCIDERIKEINFGEWELKKWDSINLIDYNNWINDFVNFKYPNGESFQDLYNRVIEFYIEVIQKEFNKVIIITHSGVIKSILSYHLDIPLIKAPSINIDFGNISQIDINNSYIKILYINR